MKLIRVILLCVFAVLAVAVVVLLLAEMGSRRNSPKEWLALSVPTIELRTNSQEALFSFVLSNAGPRSLEFGRGWLECRTKAGPSPKFVIQNISGLPWLAPGSAKRVTNYLPWRSGNDAEPLLCCGIAWSERGSFLRRTAQALANANWVDWTYRWRSEPLAEGTTCASNIGVGEYFRVVHGWERGDWDRWWKEVEAEREAERNLPPTRENFLRRYGLVLAANATNALCQKFTNSVWAPTNATGQKFTNSAWNHFAYHCRSRSSLADAPSAEPLGAANRSQPVRSQTNKTSAAAGSGR